MNARRTCGGFERGATRQIPDACEQERRDVLAAHALYRGDERLFGDTLAQALPVPYFSGIMMAERAEIPYPILRRISERIIAEAPHVNRVVCNITRKSRHDRMGITDMKNMHLSIFFPNFTARKS